MCPGQLYPPKLSYSCPETVLGTEHLGDANTPAHPSYCTLPLFHRPHLAGEAPPGGAGYISIDGHHYSCRNPALMQQAYHVYAPFVFRHAISHIALQHIRSR